MIQRLELHRPRGAGAAYRPLPEGRCRLRIGLAHIRQHDGFSRDGVFFRAIACYAPAFELLAYLRHEFEQRIADEISGWPIQPVHASLFGSAARGDGDTASDIDIFIVRSNEIDVENADWRRQLEQLADHIYGWSGNRASISEISQRELARLRREQAPIVADLRSDAITLAGPAATELLKARR